MLRLGARRQATRPRRARRRLRHAGAHGVPESHLVDGGGGARHPPERAQRSHRAHVRLGHGRHPLRVCVHRGRSRRARHGSGRGEAQSAERRRGYPQHGYRRRPRVGGGLRFDGAAVLRAGRPATHGGVRHHRRTAGAGRREEPHARVEESQRALQQGRHAGAGAVLPDDREPAAPVHVLADHRRRGRGRPGQRRARAGADGPAHLDSRQRPGARRLPADVAARRLRALAGHEARRGCGVLRRRCQRAGHRCGRGARLLLDRGAHRLRGARLL